MPSAYESMGITSETVSSRYGVSRADQDAFGVASNAKALAAIKEGRFKDEIIPIATKVDGKDVVFDTDDGPRPNPPSRAWASCARPSRWTACRPPATRRRPPTGRPSSC